MTKIAETTHIIANLARATKSSTLRRTNNVSVSREISSASVAKIAPKIQPNKFKTGGIVATAAVHPTTQKSRRTKYQNQQLPAMRNINKSITNNGSNNNCGNAVNVETDNEPPTNVKDFMKKVKSKIKKKKNKQKSAVN